MFRFTIRDLMWLTAMAAMGAAWWLDHSRSHEERERLRKRDAQLHEIRQMLGGDKALQELVAMAEANNKAPARLNRGVINLTQGAKTAHLGKVPNFAPRTKGTTP